MFPKVLAFGKFIQISECKHYSNSSCLLSFLLLFLANTTAPGTSAPSVPQRVQNP